MNKYEKWYKQITDRGQIRVLDTYFETHHIIPRSLGGSNANTNVTKLTAREHFICHWLLIKIYKEGDSHWKMLNALRIMRAENKNQNRYNTRITSKVYESIKKEYSFIQSKKISGENNPMYGEKFRRSEEGSRRQKEAVSGEKNGSKKPDARAKIANSKIGVKREEFNEEWKENLSKNHKSKQQDFDGSHSDETKRKIGDKIRGRKQSEEEKRIRSLANMGKKREKKLCPHCQQMVSVNTYPRWHGENCRYKA